MEEGDRSLTPTYSLRTKYIITFTILFGHFSLGFLFTFFGPTINDFGQKYNEDIDVVSNVFTFMTVSFICSAIFFGVVSRWVNRQIFLIVLLSIMTVSMFAIPHAPSMWLFFVLSCTLGFGIGASDPAFCAWMIEIWRGEADVYILSQHFCYSVGTILPPLIAAPFLNDDVTITTVKISTTSFPSSTEGAGEVDLVVPFSIGGGVGAAAVLCQIFLYFKLRSEKVTARRRGGESLESLEIPTVEKTTTTKEEKIVENETISVEFTEKVKGQRSPDMRRTIILVLLSCLFIAFFVGLEHVNMQFLPTFAVNSKLKLLDSEASRVLFGLTMAYAVGRAIGIFVVLKVKPQLILCGNFLLMTAASLILYFGGQESRTWLWVGSVVMGAGLSTVFPAFYAYMEKHLHITDQIVAFIAVTSGIVPVIYQQIVGNSVEKHPNVMNYVAFVSVSVAMTSFGALYWYTMIRGRKGKDGIGR